MTEQTLREPSRRAASLTPMPSLLNPEPMLTFEPTMPADVHDQRTDRVIRWNPGWADSWHECRYYVRGVIEWKGLLLDEWAPANESSPD